MIDETARLKKVKSQIMSDAERDVRKKLADLSTELQQLNEKKQEVLKLHEAIERRMLQVSGAINEIYPTLPKRS